MAFEILDSSLLFSKRSATRRAAAVLFSVAAFLILLWCCDVAYHAKPVEPEQGRPTDVQRTGLDR